MKSKVIFGIFILVSMVTNVTAAPISHAKIKQLIKKAAEAPYLDYKLLAGMDDGIQQGGTSCRKAKVNKVTIHKIGKVGTSSYRIFNSMEDNRKIFTNQGFDVTFSLQGSCKLDAPAYVGDAVIRKSGAKYSRIIRGRVPFRNKHLVATISRDSFYRNKWGSSAPEVLNKNETLKQRTSYRIKLYNKIGKNNLCRDFNYSGLERWNLGMNAPVCQVISASDVKSDFSDQANLQKINLLEKELRQHIRSYPGADKIILSQSQSAIKKGFSRILEGKTRQERHRLFIQTLNNWKRGRVSTHRYRSAPTRSSNRHSHGGRYHTHALPARGKAHRHGNGPIGR